MTTPAGNHFAGIAWNGSRMTSRQDSPETAETPDVEERGDSADWRQFALVALAVLALVVAALAVPPLAPGADAGSSNGSEEGDVRNGLQGAPPINDSDGGGEPSGDGSGGTPDGATGSGSGQVGGEGDDVRTGFPSNRTIHTLEDPPLDPDAIAGELDDGCWVVAHGRPVPGTTLNVSVWRDRDPVPDRPAWFDGRFVGRTGADGRVAGPMPYETEFDVTVDVPAATDCRFVTALPANRSGAASLGVPASRGEAGSTGSEQLASDQVAGAGPLVGPMDTTDLRDPVQFDVRNPDQGWTDPRMQVGTSYLSVGAGVGVARNSDEGTRTDETDWTGGGTRTDETDWTGGGTRTDGIDGLDGTEGPDATESGPGENGTVSETYTIEGDVSVAVDGTAYPGATLGIEARLGGVPVADGRVSVDGRRVGRTDPEGRSRVRVPTNAAGEVEIAVRRGDFTGSTRVEIHDLRLSLAPARPLPVPGQRGIATVTLAGDPVANATVTLAGERLGRTARNGSLAFALPASPGGSISASARGIETSAPLWPLFVPTIVAVGVAGLVGVAATARAWRSRGRASARRVAAVWAGATAVLLGYVLGGGSGGLLAAVAVGTLGIAMLLRQRRRTVGFLRAGGSVWIEAIRRRLRRVVLALVVAILAVADAILGLADAILGLADRALALAKAAGGWLDAQRAAGIALVDLFALFRSIPGLIAGGLGLAITQIRRVVGTLRARVGYRALTGLLAAGAVLGVVIWQWGPVWGLAAALALILVVVLVSVIVTAVRSADRGESDASGGPADPSMGAAGERHREQTSLRQLWRRFAQAVAPGRWRTRTPGEIARAAVDGGLPAGPVRRLTEAFRAVEYGDRTPDDAETRRAREAYETLRTALVGDEEGEEP